MDRRPQLIVVGGPTGCGKTTVAMRYSSHAGLPYLGAEALAPKSPDVCVARVAERVRKGGHDVPEEDIRRRSLRTALSEFDHSLTGQRHELFGELDDFLGKPPDLGNGGKFMAHDVLPLQGN